MKVAIKHPTPGDRAQLLAREDRRGQSFIKTTKTGRERTVPLSPLALTVLKSHRATQLLEKMRNRDKYTDLDLVFANEVGGMLDLDAVSKAFASLARAAGIKGKGISLQSCRHFSATQALVAGNDVRTVSALLGHASPSTTLNVYGHVVGVPRSGPSPASATRSQQRRPVVRPVRIDGRESALGSEWQPRAVRR